MHAVELGADLRGVTLLAFGGAGPVHACGVAELLESPRVIFPVNASVLSALGTLVSPVRIDLARSMVRPIQGIDEAERDALLSELREEGHRVLIAAGADPASVTFRYGVDARYIGQGNEITIWMGEGNEFPGNTLDIVNSFETDYRRIYGLTIPDVGVEAVTWRLSAYAKAEEFEPLVELSDKPGAPHGTRAVRFTRQGEPIMTPVYRRSDIGCGQVIEGPVIIEERETTAVIRPNWTVTLGNDGSVIADRKVK
jgi:N-methylhydantoinase A